MDWASVRFISHLMLIVLASTWISSLWKLRNGTVKIMWAWVGIIGLAFLIAFALGLIASMKEGGIVPRSLLVPYLATTEFGAGAFGLTWTVLCLPHNFQLQKRSTPVVDPS